MDPRMEPEPWDGEGGIPCPAPGCNESLEPEQIACVECGYRLTGPPKDKMNIIIVLQIYASFIALGFGFPFHRVVLFWIIFGVCVFIEKRKKRRRECSANVPQVR